MEIKKILTEQPMMDELIYQLKIITSGTILKDEEEADNAETSQSMFNGDLYVSCIEGRANLSMFEKIPIDVLKRFNFSDSSLELLSNDYTIIENMYSDYADAILEATQKYFIENYVELNPYYRRLNGLPDGVNDTDYIDSDLISSSTFNSVRDICLTTPIHKLDENIINLLISYDVISDMISRYPEKKYLNFLSANKKIDIYTARSALKFEALYIPTIESDSEPILSKFKDKLEINRVYMNKVLYNNAFKLGSDYYDKVMIIFILIQTMIAVLDDYQDFIIRREAFDLRTIQYIFESNGVEYFSSIPMKYQKALLKNLNTLIKYKSTTRNMIDICSLFGYDNIKLFKYYILISRILDEDGNLVYETEYDEVVNDDGVVQLVPVGVKPKYELKFVQMPIDAYPDDYIHNSANYLDYEDVISMDPTWNGTSDKTATDVYNDILSLEFSAQRSKYISIDTVYDLTDNIFNSVYFFNMIFDSDKHENSLMLSIPTIDSNVQFRFTDVICFLYSLMYLYNGVKDTIMDTPDKVLFVKGFDSLTDVAALATYMKNNGLSVSEMYDSDNNDKPFIKVSISKQSLIDSYAKEKGVLNPNETTALEYYANKAGFNISDVTVNDNIDMSLYMQKFVSYLLAENGKNTDDIDYDIVNEDIYIEGFNYETVNPEVVNRTFGLNKEMPINEFIEKYTELLKSKGISDPKITFGYKNFSQPLSEDMLTYTSLLNTFNTNKNIYKYILKQMASADNKEIYDIYKTLYDSLMITKYTNIFFTKSDGTEATSFRDYLNDGNRENSIPNLLLYDKIEELSSIDDTEIRNQEIFNIMNDVIYYLEKYTDNNNFDFIANNFPVVSGDVVKGYIYKVLNFFKSYKLNILQIKTIYTINDKTKNKISMIDDMIITTLLNPDEQLASKDGEYYAVKKQERDDYINGKFPKYRLITDNVKRLISIIYNDSYIDKMYGTMYREGNKLGPNMPLYYKDGDEYKDYNVSTYNGLIQPILYLKNGDEYIEYNPNEFIMDGIDIKTSFKMNDYIINIPLYYKDAEGIYERFYMNKEEAIPNTLYIRTRTGEYIEYNIDNLDPEDSPYRRIIDCIAKYMLTYEKTDSIDTIDEIYNNAYITKRSDFDVDERYFINYFYG